MESLANILKAFTGNKWKIFALILVLISINIGTLIKMYYTQSDCSPLIKQNNELVKSQNNLTALNSQILQKNQDLINGYMQIQDLLKNFKQDTIYITKERTTLHSSSMQEVMSAAPKFTSRLETIDSTHSTSDSTISIDFLLSQQPKLFKPITSTSVSVTQKYGNHKEVIDKIQSIIDKKSKK